MKIVSIVVIALLGFDLVFSSVHAESGGWGDIFYPTDHSLFDLTP